LIELTELTAGAKAPTAPIIPGARKHRPLSAANTEGSETMPTQRHDTDHTDPTPTAGQPAPEVPMLPARMANEYVYCPRLAYLEWVQSEWAPSADTVEGAHQHRRVDRREGRLPPAEDLQEDQRIHARSVTLSSSALGVIAKLDLIESEGGEVVPVDYKHGKRPHISRGAYDPERVQLCLQGLLLAEHGYTTHEGVIYYVASKERVPVPFDDELTALTREAVAGLRALAAGGQIPEPLEDSPKCPGCSLVGICLPDEVHFLKHAGTPPRALAVARDEAMPVYVQAHHGKVSKHGEVLEIRVDDDKVSEARLSETSQLVVMGNVYVTTPCLNELMRREIPISWYSYGGWFLGHSMGTGHKNVELRTAQYRASFDERTCLDLARGLVHNKVLNCRTLLRRNWRGDDSPDAIAEHLHHDAEAAARATHPGELLGIEGAAAARYFGAFAKMIKADPQAPMPFDFNGRNRRPPRDPVNALLSFAYAILVRHLTVTLSAVGFDPYRGYYHQPRYGRPALALDLMEAFRPIIADSAVIQAINNGEVHPTDFVTAGGGVALTPEGRRRFIAALERRLSHEVTHPVFGYKASYRRILELQARLLGRYLLAELPEYPGFLTR
jgi:CRISPR-associated protein Cas1